MGRGLSGMALAALAVVGTAVGAAADEAPAMQWDHRPKADEWTDAVLTAVDDHGRPLLSLEPADVADYCPAYEDASEEDRQAFWGGLLSALAKYESRWREDAVGGEGQWYGLLQIAPATAQNYDCRAETGGALLEGTANLSCAVRIIAETAPRDEVIAADDGGLAADWAPMQDDEKRAEIAAWTSQQDYCQG